MSHSMLSNTSEWTFDLLQEFDEVISKIAAEFQLDTFPVQLEVINSEQMIDVYSAVGMPLGYNHWSFGKQFIDVDKKYRRGITNLAYEIVINSNPCIAYLLEENTMVMQATVIAHACYGHNSFFKNNYLFQTWTDPDSIIDYLLFAKNYILGCEERYGVEAVESLLDSCHALMNHGVNRYKRPPQLSIFKENAKQKAREAYLQSQVNDLWRTIPTTEKTSAKTTKKDYGLLLEPEENLLYFLEKNAPLLHPWQREIIRITRKIAQYFYPQRQTKVMNEGWASFWHYTIINELYQQKYVDDTFMLEFLHNHSNLLLQLPYDDPRYNGINPYTLGFNLFKDIRRICEHPTDEDRQWFPDIVDTNWIETLNFAMQNFKDDSFIAQYLSPHLIRELKLFSILNDTNSQDILITAIHNQDGYQYLRSQLAAQYNLSNLSPNIEITHADIHGDRTLSLMHTMHNDIPLGEDTDEVLKHLHQLWGYPVQLKSINDQDEEVSIYNCPSKASPISSQNN